MSYKRHIHHRAFYTDEKDTVTGYLDEEICIEAKLTVNPEVSIGQIDVECLESTIEPTSTVASASDECTMVVSQLVRVKIPVHFKAIVETDENNIGCTHNPHPSVGDFEND